MFSWLQIDLAPVKPEERGILWSPMEYPFIDPFSFLFAQLQTGYQTRDRAVKAEPALYATIGRRAAA